MFLLFLLTRTKNSTTNALYQKALSLWSGQDQSAALKLFKRAADSGHRAAQLHYARILSNASAPFSNPEEASRYYELAVLASNSSVELEYGKLLWRGKALPQDQFKAFYFIKKAAESGDPRAQAKYGKLLLRSISMTPNHTLALKYLKLAAESGHPPSQHSLAVYLWKSDSADEAIEYCKRSADQGYLPAMVEIGNWLSGTERKNVSLAMEWFGRAAKLGSSEAQYRLGSALWLGEEGVEGNRTKGKKLLKRAAENGNEEAQRFVGREILWGQNKTVKAIRYFQQFPDAVDPDIAFEVAKALVKEEGSWNILKAVKYCNLTAMESGKDHAKARIVWRKIVGEVELSLAKREMKLDG